MLISFNGHMGGCGPVILYWIIKIKVFLICCPAPFIQIRVEKITIKYNIVMA